MLSLFPSSKMKRIRLCTIFLIVTNLLYLFVDASLCPSTCVCSVVDGRKQIRCEAGGLSLSDNFLKSIDRDTKVLYIAGSKNNLNNFDLNSAIFQHASFEEIHLSFSSLSIIPASAFLSVSSSLRVLNLSSNSIQLLQRETFDGLSALTHLHLDENFLTSLSLSTFSHLPNLKVLTLSNNLISDIIQEPVVALNQLEILDLSFNLIGEPIESTNTLSETFFRSVRNLRTFNISNNRVKSLPWTAIDQYNPNLNELNLAHNKIEDILPNQISSVQSLKRVSLRGNPIRSISDEAFRGLQLDSLDLSEFPAKTLESDIFVGLSVKELDLSNMKLHKFSQETFRPIAENLLTLNISENPDLCVNPHMFKLFTSLRKLSMTNTHKVTLPAHLFTNGNVIEDLDISKNGLTHLPAVFFKTLHNLRRLNLSHNQLHRIPQVIDLTNIREIDLSNNRLADLPKQAIDAFSQPTSLLRSLKLNENPWNCDCKVAALSRWIGSLGFGNFGYETVCMDADRKVNCPVCSAPAALKGTPINRMPVELLSRCGSADDDL